MQGAKALHRALATDATVRGTTTLRGVQDGEHVELTLAFDLDADLLHVVDRIADSEVVSRGRIVASLGADASQWRHDGAVSFTDATMADEEANVGATTAALEPFEAQTSWFATRCVVFRGETFPALHYEEHGLYEVWVFDPRSGDVLQAVHVNNLTGTDIAVTFSREALVPALDESLPRLPGTVRLLELFAEFVDADADHFLFREVLAEGTEPLSYDDLSLVLLDENGDAIEELPFGADIPGDFGSFRLVDSGELGVTDEGDEWQVTLGPYADTWLVWDAWAEEWLDIQAPEAADASGAPRPSDAGPATAVDGAVIARSYAWSYAGQEWTWEVEIPQALYDHYVDTPFVYADGEHAYDIYVSSPHDDPFIKSLADQLTETGVEQRWSDAEVLAFALSFIHSLEYTSDDVTTGFDEYPRYPVETLMDIGGDCEDTSILFASIAIAIGHDAVMLSPPGHMAVGIATQSSVDGVAFPYGDALYLYVETTGEGWAIGELPPEYEGQVTQVYTLEPKAVLEHTWRVGDEVLAGYQHAVLEATNVGSAAASDAELWVGLVRDDEELLAADACDFAAIEAGETATCSVWLELPPSGAIVRVAFILSAQPLVFLEDESEPWKT